MTKDNEVEDDSAEEPPVKEKDTDEEVKAKDNNIKGGNIISQVG